MSALLSGRVRVPNRLQKMGAPKFMPKSVPSQFVWSRSNATTKVFVSLGGHFFYSTQNDVEQTFGRHFGIHFLCSLFSPQGLREIASFFGYAEVTTLFLSWN